MGVSKIKNKTIVITGAGRGIGKEIALQCARDGARLVIAARTADELSETEKEAKQYAQCTSVICDVAKDSDVERLFSKVSNLHGIVCAAGILGGLGPFADISMDDWNNVFQVNVLGSIRCVRAAYPLMKRNGEGRVLLFSGAGQGPMPRLVPYASSKGAIWRLTESLGAELAPEKIFVNAIAPGAVNTQLLQEIVKAGPDKVGREYFKQVEKTIAGGSSLPQKAIDLALFLLGPESKGLWGKILSAVWDPYRNLKDLEKVSASDLYQVRRVVDANGGTRGV